MNDNASSSHTEYDVVIVGGGMVGASLGAALAQLPLKIAVVEAVPFEAVTQPSYDERTVALTLGSRRIFEGIGVWRHIAERDATAIRQIHVSDRGHPGVTRLEARHAGEEALGYVVPTRAIGAVLNAHLTDHPRVDLVCPAAVEQIEIGADAAELIVRAAGEVCRLQTRLVALADGGRSALRSALALRVREVDYQRVALVTTVVAERDHGGSAYERFTPDGPLALLPIGERTFAVVWTLEPEQGKRYAELDEDAFLGGLQRCFGERAGRFEHAGARRLYPLHLTRIDEPVRPRLAVLGNAAHTVHPVAGQGFNLGLRDVAALADVLSDAVAAGNDIGSAPVLDCYARWRRRDTEAVSWFTHGLVRIFGSRCRPIVAARSVGLLGIDLLPAVKRALLRRTMGLAGRQSRLGLGLPLSAPPPRGRA